jgi:hypothetical protein
MISMAYIGTPNTKTALRFMAGTERALVLESARLDVSKIVVRIPKETPLT